MAMSTNEQIQVNYRQWQELKAKHPDAVILFRWDDTYCTFDSDTETLISVCNCQILDWYGIRAAGFPSRALDVYLPKLVRAGYRIAICDRLEKPQQTVRRGITETISQQGAPRKRIEAKQLELFTF